MRPIRLWKLLNNSVIVTSEPEFLNLFREINEDYYQLYNLDKSLILRFQLGTATFPPPSPGLWGEVWEKVLLASEQGVENVTSVKWSDFQWRIPGLVRLEKPSSVIESNL